MYLGEMMENTWQTLQIALHTSPLSLSQRVSTTEAYLTDFTFGLTFEEIFRPQIAG